MTCEPLDVVAVPFPLTDRPAAKRRPALVVSSAAFNHAHAPLGAFDPLALQERVERSARPTEAVGLILQTVDGGV